MVLCTPLPALHCVPLWGPQGARLSGLLTADPPSLGRGFTLVFFPVFQQEGVAPGPVRER